MLKRLLIASATAILSSVPAYADAVFVFRHRAGLLPMTVAAVPGDGETETPAGPTWPSDAPQTSYDGGQVSYALIKFAPVDSTGDGRIGPGDRIEWDVRIRNDGEGLLSDVRFSGTGFPGLKEGSVATFPSFTCPVSIPAGQFETCRGSMPVTTAATICGAESALAGDRIPGRGGVSLTRARRDGEQFINSRPVRVNGDLAYYTLTSGGC
jgi:hypothetical protein